MLLYNFAHRLLLVFGVFVFATVAVLAAKFGWLGEALSDLVEAGLFPAQAFYTAYKTDLDFAARVIGAIGTALGAVWAVHKGWHYAERNLPERLKEYNARWKASTETTRADFIPELVQIASIAPLPATQPSLFKRLVSWVHNADQQALANWQTKLAQYEDDFSVLTSSKVRCRAQVVTAYLVLGSQIARATADQGQRALDFFRSALKANRTDLDAMELLAKQQFALGFHTEAYLSLEKMVTAASNANDRLRHARALRYQAEILHGSQSAPDWAKARAKLVAAASTLDGTDSLKADTRNCELALVYDLLANVQITRERFTAAQTELERARRLFDGLRTSCGREGLDRVTRTSKRLDDAKKDRDNPDVQD